MKMGKLEELFVNRPGHREDVARHAQELLRRVPVQPGQCCLDFGCGNRMAPLARLGDAVAGAWVGFPNRPAI